MMEKNMSTKVAYYIFQKDVILHGDITIDITILYTSMYVNTIMYIIYRNLIACAENFFSINNNVLLVIYT